jgi:DNA-binding FadR family transcriptional regulator
MSCERSAPKTAGLSGSAVARLRRPQRLVDAVIEEVVDIIVAGEVTPGSALPAESELARRIGVSRLTLREAIQRLNGMGVLEPQHGRGTFVRPVELWSPLDPVVLAARSALLGEDLGERLLEARRIVEIAATRLAAERREPHHLTELENQLEAMRGAAAQPNLDAWVAADIRFHAVVLEAAGNPVIAALFDAIGKVVLDVRRRTSALPERWRRAIDAHERVLRAVEAGDATGAEQAMAAHLADTEEDMLATRTAAVSGASVTAPSATGDLFTQAV